MFCRHNLSITLPVPGSAGLRFLSIGVQRSSLVEQLLLRSQKDKKNCEATVQMTSKTDGNEDQGKACAAADE